MICGLCGDSYERGHSCADHGDRCPHGFEISKSGIKANAKRSGACPTCRRESARIGVTTRSRIQESND